MRLKRAVCASNSSQGAAVARACTVKRGATIADLASELLAKQTNLSEAVIEQQNKIVVNGTSLTVV